jgi:hypothetical protein
MNKTVEAISSKTYGFLGSVSMAWKYSRITKRDRTFSNNPSKRVSLHQEEVLIRSAVS